MICFEFSYTGSLTFREVSRDNGGLVMYFQKTFLVIIAPVIWKAAVRQDFFLFDKGQVTLRLY